MPRAPSCSINNYFKPDVHSTINIYRSSNSTVKKNCKMFYHVENVLAPFFLEFPRYGFLSRAQEQQQHHHHHQWMLLLTTPMK